METFILILAIISCILYFHEELGFSEKWDSLIKSPKTQPSNKFAKAVQNLELMDKTKYNCVIRHNGEWIYGWMENTGISYAEGMYSEAHGENAIINNGLMLPLFKQAEQK